jgi:N-formylglutamate amidohydrolase
MKQTLFFMLHELQEYKRDRESLMSKYVAERLNKSFQTYDKELQQSIQFLTQKHEKSIIKRIKKLDDKSN